MWGCQKVPTPQSGLFNTQAFFDNEITHLSTQNSTLKKWLTYNGKKDSVILTSNINWEKELQLFKEVDLSKPVYKQAFRITEHINQQHLLTQIYEAIDDKLPIKEVIITYDANNQVSNIEITSNVSNILYNGEKRLRYVRDSGFYINEKQFLKNGTQTSYQVKGVFGQQTKMPQ